MEYNWLVDIEVRLAAVVLPVMCIHAFGLIVLCEVERTELSLVIEHVEVVIFQVVVDQSGQDFLLRVGVGAKISIRAVLNAMWIVRAELFLVLLVVVVLFHEGMRIEAGISFGTFLFLLHVAAHLSVVEVPVALTVLRVVVVHAVLVVVSLGYVAGSDLERLQVEVLCGARNTLTMGAMWN